jgi:predicted ArsR family transcriptional regulator
MKLNRSERAVLTIVRDHPGSTAEDVAWHLAMEGVDWGLNMTRRALRTLTHREWLHREPRKNNAVTMGRRPFHYKLTEAGRRALN